MITAPSRLLLAAAAVLAAGCMAPSTGRQLGAFTGQSDIGVVSRPGTAVYDPAAATYTVGASGANMWFKQDAMHFLWKQAGGDLSLAADIGFVGESAQPHRKACLVIRQNLTPGSAYVDVAVHGEGLTSLQYRDSQDGITREIQSMVSNPRRVRLGKIGDTVYLSLAQAGEEPRPSGASIQIRFTEPFFVGLAVSAHDNSAFETAVFSKVNLGPASQAAAAPQPNLKVITLPSGDRRVSER